MCGIGKRATNRLIVSVNPRERFLAAAKCCDVDRPPLWMMRQAGRYLPEYRNLRAGHSFGEMVHVPELAAEVTLQPLKRFGFDAAIIFSDILSVPEAMGQPYSLGEGDEQGISMAYALRHMEQVRELVAGHGSVRARLDYVAEALRIVRAKLGDETALLGFAGSPWTLACYMVEGGGAHGGQFTKAAHMAVEAPAVFELLMEKLTDAVAAHLIMQIEAGADAVQIFDTWAAACPYASYRDLSLKWIARIVRQLPQEVPVMLFAKGVEQHADALVDTGATVLSFDHMVDLRAVADALPPDVAVQGNLDPVLMEGEPDAVRRETQALLERMRGRRGHIVNLGHGIRPQARLDSVQALVDTVRDFK